MKIQPFVLGFGYTNCYIAYQDEKAFLIDAPNGMEGPISFLKDNGLNLQAVLLTHGHYDHILGLAEIRSSYPDVDIYISKDDSCFLEDGGKANIELLRTNPYIVSAFKDAFASLPTDYLFYKDKIGPFDVIKSPGHTYGSICLYSKKENVLFSGDTLFASGIGRTDLGGNYSDILNSLNTLKALDDNTTVLPGHGEFTTIKKEKDSNPYF